MDAHSTVRNAEQRENSPSEYVGFQCKYFSDGSICKLKVHLCVCGDKQVQGVDVFESYSPVIHWTTICLI